MGDDDLDLLHVGHCRGMTTDVATGLSRATATFHILTLPPRSAANRRPSGVKATLNDVMSPFTLPGKVPPSGVRLATFQSRLPVACIGSRCDRSLGLVCSGRGAKGALLSFQRMRRSVDIRGGVLVIRV
jgi:hypothetical protein